MKRLAEVWVRSGTVLTIAVLAAWAAACSPAPAATVPPHAAGSALSQGTACGPAVSHKGRVIRVEPAGAALDTVNLQCAFDLAAARPGSTVELARGTFVSGALFVHGFSGAIRGAGQEETLVVNVPVLQVNPDFWVSGAPPSRDNVYPFLWTFTDSRFSMRDLKFRIQGASPTSGWIVPGLDPTIDSLAAVVVVTGQDVRAELGRVAFEGEATAVDPLYGFNLYNGVYFEPVRFDGPPVTGSFTVHACRFRSMAAWAPIYNAADAFALIADNEAEDLFLALDVFVATRSTVIFANNRVRGAVVAAIGEGAPLDASVVIVAGNRIEAQQGLLVDGVFSGGTRCFVTGNWIDPPSAGITLGPATSHCLVAGNHGATVVDQGTGNHVVGR